MSKDRVKNEIHCRVKPDVMQYIINQAKVNNCSVSDVCRLLIERGMRFDEELSSEKARILKVDSPSLTLLNLLERTDPNREVAEALSMDSNEDEYADDENEIEGWG